jgi:hypothetical protein
MNMITISENNLNAVIEAAVKAAVMAVTAGKTPNKVTVVAPKKAPAKPAKKVAPAKAPAKAVVKAPAVKSERVNYMEVRKIFVSNIEAQGNSADATDIELANLSKTSKWIEMDMVKYMKDCLIVWGVTVPTK